MLNLFFFLLPKNDRRSDVSGAELPFRNDRRFSSVSSNEIFSLMRWTAGISGTASL